MVLSCLRGISNGTFISMTRTSKSDRVTLWDDLVRVGGTLKKKIMIIKYQNYTHKQKEMVRKQLKLKVTRKECVTARRHGGKGSPGGHQTYPKLLHFFFL